MKYNWRYRFVEFWIRYWDLQKFFAPPRALPKNLVFVRHGESVGNVAVALSLNGDHSMLDGWYKEGRHSRTWELTEKGREQAKRCGIWLKENGMSNFQHCYVSKYDRAIETAKSGHAFRRMV